MDRWLKIGIILIVVGSTLLIVDQIVFGSNFRAFVNAMRSFAENHAVGSPPTPEEYGLTTTSLYMIAIFGYAGGICLFIGGAYVIINFIGKIVKRLGAPVLK